MSCPVCLPGVEGELCDAHSFHSGLVWSLNDQRDQYGEEMALVECETPHDVVVDLSLYEELPREELVAFVQSALNGGDNE
jgi:hypothetical protein